jgi:DNA-binding MarR family transcriptional regulator
MQTSEPFISALHDWAEVFMRHSMRDFILYSKTSGLSISQIRTLFQIHRRGATVSDIGDELGVTNAAASQLLDRLVREGLIKRSEDPRDRRVKQIILTDKGKHILEEIIRSRQVWLSALASYMTPAEQADVIDALHILIEKTNQLEQAGEHNELCEEQPEV